MFELSLLDHLRLTFGHVVSRHKTHSKIALSHARWSRRLKHLQSVAIVAVALLALRAASGGGQPFAVASAIVAGVAFATLVLELELGLDASARAHADCATRLWHVRERYRVLLSDLADGVIGIEDARQKRDELMEEMRKIYEQAPPLAGLTAYRAADARVAPYEGSLSDEDIDQLLPRVFQKEWKPAA